MTKKFRILKEERAFTKGFDDGITYYVEYWDDRHPEPMHHRWDVVGEFTSHENAVECYNKCIEWGGQVKVSVVAEGESIAD